MLIIAGGSTPVKVPSAIRPYRMWFSGLFEGLLEVRSKVLDALAADRQTDEVIGDASHLPVLFRQAGMSHAGRVLDETFNPPKRDGQRTEFDAKPWF